MKLWLHSFLQVTVAAIGVGLGSSAVSAAEKPKASDDIVMMSPYEVMARSTEFKGWTKLRSPNFILYTDARLKEARPMVRQMEMLRLAEQVKLGRRPLLREPVRVIMPSARSDWKKIKSKGSVLWEVAVSTTDTVADTVTVEYDWQRNGARVLWAGLGGLECRRMGLRLSMPMSQGFGFYFETIEQSKDGLRIGEGNRRAGYLRGRDWLPWDQVFRMTAGSKAYRVETSALHLFSGQAALFVHYMMTRQDDAIVDQLLQWDAIIQSAAGPDEARFQLIFGMDYAGLTERLNAFLEGEEFPVSLFNFPPELLDFVVTEVDVGTTEMRELFILQQINNQAVPASTESLDALLESGLATAELEPLLIEACLHRDRREAGLALLEKRIPEGRASARDFEVAAWLRFSGEVERTNDLNARLQPETVDRVRRYAQFALEREPQLVAVSTVLAWTEALAPELAPDALAKIKALAQAVEGNGGTDELLAAFAVAAYRSGDYDRARRAIHVIEASTYAGVDPQQLAAQLELQLADQR